MAYSDYGGYAFLNGKRVEERSDCSIHPDKLVGTPGMWPGFDPSNIIPGTNDHYPSGHAVLGDGPIFLALYKQSTIRIHRGGEEINEINCLSGEYPEDVIWSYDDGGVERKAIEADWFKAEEKPCLLEIDGRKITLYWEFADNHYQYARLEEPNGNVWCGWSGYGVGAGLEDCGYGYSTKARNNRLLELWPDAITEPAAQS